MAAHYVARRVCAAVGALDLFIIIMTSRKKVPVSSFGHGVNLGVLTSGVNCGVFDRGGLFWGFLIKGVPKGGLRPREVILGNFGKIRNFNLHKWSATAMKQTRHAT